MDRFKLRFDLGEVEYWAARYSYPKEPYILTVLAPRIRTAGFLTKDDLKDLGEWKARKRVLHLLEKNNEEKVVESTRIALSCRPERQRMGTLTQLDGVNKSIASAILHFCHHDPYPILDFRALWSLGFDTKPRYYSFDLWWAYTRFCRGLAQAAGVSMRVLDRALWQYSSENQPTPSKKSKKRRS